MIRKLESIFENLVRDFNAAKERAALSAKLAPFDRIPGDSYALYHRYEAQQQEIQEVWQGKLWFENLYNAKHTELKSAQDEFAALQNSLPEATLSLYQNGGVGFRYILKYVAAWLRFKLFGRKDDGM